ncbi:hypothetical protein BDW75DRAFT_204793 [Aspergillus navahoensis]
MPSKDRYSPPLLPLHVIPFSHKFCLYCEKGPKMSTTRYKDPVPAGVRVFTTLDEAAKIQGANPSAIFYPENNGHYAKDPDGTVVARGIGGVYVPESGCPLYEA